MSRINNVVWWSAVLPLALLWGCKNDEAQLQKETKPKPILVQVVEIQPRPLQSTVELVGTIEAKVSTKILAPTDGAIEELRVLENDLVQKNQVVGLLSSSDRLALLGETHARLEQLRSKTGTTNPSSKDEALRKELQRAAEEYDYAQRLFLPTPIVSPIKGWVIDKPIEIGSMVSSKQVLMTVADLEQLIIRTAVSELLLTKLSIGQRIPVQVSAYPDREFSGRISLVSPRVDPATRTGEIEVRIADPGRRLKPGMFASLSIVTERRERALSIPSDVILVRADGRQSVFVVQDSVAHLRVITPGISTKTLVEVREGLNPGDKVVVMGQELLKDGIPVKVQAPKKAPPGEQGGATKENKQ